MINYISKGDFIDIYHKIRLNGMQYMLNRFGIKFKSKVKKSWNVTNNHPSNWWDINEIQERWNTLITGNNVIEYPEYVASKYGKNPGFKGLLLIEVDGKISAQQAHEISIGIEESIREDIKNVFDIMIHIEPSGFQHKEELYGISEQDLECE